MAPSLPKTYKAAVFEEKGTNFKLKDIDLKEPGKGQILVKVIACGVCHTDSFLQQGFLPNSWPRIPGHELVGDVVAVGDGVTRVKVGERVGGPWHGGKLPFLRFRPSHMCGPTAGAMILITDLSHRLLGHDGTCRSCQQGLFQMCDTEEINGVTMDGGYAEYVLLRAEAAVRIPADADPAETAPLLCAGVTVFNGMRNMDIRAGSVVAIQGLGGLGHLAVQFANKMGYNVVALSSGASKKDFATKLGAHHYVDTSKEDPSEALQVWGGAALIVATAPNPKAISPLVSGLGPRGKLLVLAPVGPVEFDTMTLVNKGASVHGWPSGHALDSEDCIQFAKEQGVKCMIEKFPLSDVQKAFENMTSGNVRFRAVLTM